MSTKLVWITPDAEKIVAKLARVSNPAGQDKHETAPRLISYLIRNKHWSPFEMVSMCVELETTRDIARQLLRHRSFAFQEFSQRYASASVLPVSALREVRLQDNTNRQNSLPTNNPELSMEWDNQQLTARSSALRAYEWALVNGIAREVARAVLPEGLTTTRMYMAGTLRSWIHFCELRMGNGTQLETQTLARAVWSIMNEQCPMITEAVENVT